MTTLENTSDFAQCAAGMADAATLLAEAAQQLSEAARALGQGIFPDSQALIDSGKPSSEHELAEDDELSTCQSNAENPNTGNNILRPDSPIGTSNTSNFHAISHNLVDGLDRSGIHDRQSQDASAPASTVTDQDKFRDSVISPGRYYIVLEEEFDILPLIVAYASICPKTLCCMPFIETSQSWRILLSAFLTNHEVFEVSNQLSSFSPSAAQYISSNKASLLIQSFASWQTHRTVSSISDSFLVWGFLNVGEEQLARIQDTIVSTKHTCAIVTSQEYLRSSFKTYLSSLGFIKHPASSLIKQSHAKALLAGSRKTVQKVLRKRQFRENIQTLYKECLEYYKFPPSKGMWWSETRVAELANAFAARTLLNGRKDDGSTRFKPNGQLIPLDREFINKMELNRALQLGLINEDTSESWNLVSFFDDPNASSKPSCPEPDTDDWSRLKPLTYDSNTPSDSSVPADSIRQLNYAPYSLLKKKFITPTMAGGSTNREAVVSPISALLQRWYIGFQEEFDIIPFILYQVELHQKVVCFISHGSTAMPYQGLFNQMITRRIICPGKKATSIIKAISTFNSLESGFLLLRGAKNIPSSPGNVGAVIYWGVPAELPLSHNLKAVKASNVYVILSNDVDSGIQQSLTLRNGLTEYPGSAQLNSTGPESLLFAYRTQTKRALGSMPTDVPKRIYQSRVNDLLANGSREAVVRVNQFIARVLLHGKPEDGSMLHPPVRPRPFVKQKQVTKCGLQPYINEGLMWVG